MRMTIKQAIHVLHLPCDHLRNYDEYGIGIDDELQEAMQMAKVALREKAEREEPQPLTIDELKQMIGEPVWVQGPGIPEYGRWGIVEDAFGNSLYLMNDFSCHDIGKTWLAYRHKPKEVQGDV